MKHREATMNDYVSHLYKECSFEDYYGIVRANMLNMKNNPYFVREMVKTRHPDIKMWDTFLESDFFREVLHAEWEKKVKCYLLDRTVFSLLECLEENSDFWRYGNPLKVTPHGAYIPTSKPLVPFPTISQETINRKNYKRLGPFDYRSPLKSKLQIR